MDGVDDLQLAFDTSDVARDLVGPDRTVVADLWVEGWEPARSTTRSTAWLLDAGNVEIARQCGEWRDEQGGIDWDPMERTP